MPPHATAPPSLSTIADLGEAALIARLRDLVPPPGGGVVVGIGDDAAVLQPPRGCLLVQTTDTLVEGVHFDRRLCTARDVGRRAVAVNVSDLAAMGARPAWLLLALTLPAAAEVSMRVLDVQGREVGRTRTARLPAGRTTLACGGRARGAPARPGVYVALVRAGERTWSRRFAIVR